MLTAYFDDSGTHTGGKHGPSKIVLVAGIIGDENSLRVLDENWKKHLERPVEGLKDRLNRFHMFDCYDSRGEFAGWTRTETDYFCKLLQDVIIQSGVAAYGIACARQDWDELITGDLRGVLGDAESYCITQCYVRAVRFANEHPDPKITFVFDKREPEVERRGRAMAHAFAQHHVLVGPEFLSSKDSFALQAADLYAWELYQYAGQIFADGKAGSAPTRPAFKRFEAAGVRMANQIALRGSIQRIVQLGKKQDPDYMKVAAEHFTTFDPSDPESKSLLK